VPIQGVNYYNLGNGIVHLLGLLVARSVIVFVKQVLQQIHQLCFLLVLLNCDHLPCHRVDCCLLLRLEVMAEPTSAVMRLE
jgi:hypothetical protein